MKTNYYFLFTFVFIITIIFSCQYFHIHFLPFLPLNNDTFWFPFTIFVFANEFSFPVT